METRVGGTARRDRRDSWVGVLSFVAAIVTAASVTMIYLTSFLPDFNPPGWLRIASMAPFPLTTLLAVALGIVGLGQKKGRSWAVAGLAIAVLSVAAFVWTIAAGG